MLLPILVDEKDNEDAFETEILCSRAFAFFDKFCVCGAYRRGADVPVDREKTLAGQVMDVKRRD